MYRLFSEIHRKNAILSKFGWLMLVGAIICLVLTSVDRTMVSGLNAWIKPMKFFLSIAIFSWTMALYMDLLNYPKQVRWYSRMVVVVFIIEMIIIVGQAAKGQRSHFNITTPLNGILFSIMGVAITILVSWTLYIAFLFFRQKQFRLPMHVIWAIRIGLVLFIIFSFEGGLMASQLAHTVGGPDGSPGLPILNWSRVYGDLRVAHFFGMHSLQIIPLCAYFFMTNTKQVFLYSGIYSLLVVFLFIQAMRSIPVF